MQALSLDRIQAIAPSVFATEPWDKMSAKYRFFPTIDIVNGLIATGFVPTDARQSNTRIEGKENFTRHVLKFRHPDMMQKAREAIEARSTHLHHIIKDETLPEVPEIVLMNSHDGTSAYKLMLGMFRLVCCNGLIIKSGDVREVSVRHSGKESLIDDVIEGSYQIIDEAPKVILQIADWKEKKLDLGQQEAFAAAALELRDSALEVQPMQLLNARRSADRTDATDNSKRDIWTTMNVIQENLIKGGMQGRNTAGRRMRLRGVNAVDADTKLNRALWVLTEKLAEKVAA